MTRAAFFRFSGSHKKMTLVARFIRKLEDDSHIYREENTACSVVHESWSTTNLNEPFRTIYTRLPTTLATWSGDREFSMLPSTHAYWYTVGPAMCVRIYGEL